MKWKKELINFIKVMISECGISHYLSASARDDPKSWWCRRSSSYLFRVETVYTYIYIREAGALLLMLMIAAAAKADASATNQTSSASWPVVPVRIIQPQTRRWLVADKQQQQPSRSSCVVVLLSLSCLLYLYIYTRKGKKKNHSKVLPFLYLTKRRKENVYLEYMQLKTFWPKILSSGQPKRKQQLIDLLLFCSRLLSFRVIIKYCVI